ncbi:hypothetical protein KVP10_08410 [Candidimonas humi]|uniref:Uncharacterized protein n=1 Tax=Candidimonas humi TaxID=683355 RepID=A0ABV8NUL1_9BURK|nr:hypothetical protein [Candidimonas humi]MBV6304908.1 hypothetical protein [Candidimonas humi]
METVLAIDTDRKYGRYYSVLYSRGWWHNPKVVAAFGVDPSALPEIRVSQIRYHIYEECGISSLTELSPRRFMDLCTHKGIAGTVPREIAGAPAQYQ